MFGYELKHNNEVDLLHGIFIGKVVDNMDPKGLERVRVRVIGVHDMEKEEKDNSIWAEHCAPSKQTSGELPDPDDWLYVSFVHGSPMMCIWHGWVRKLG
jgi:hypothetical protein